ncbi:unnamed protein product, partial [marine sediment metagenome]
TNHQVLALSTNYPQFRLTKIFFIVELNYKK